MGVVPLAKTRRDFCQGLTGGFACALASTGNYSFHVLGLLKPQSLVVAAGPSSRALVTFSNRTRPIQDQQFLHLTAADVPVALSGDDGGLCSFLLEVPGVLRRSYFGTLHLSASNGVLLPVVTMPSETAVSSIVGSELPVSSAPLEALATQSIVARSFLIAAGPRHANWDFCDTTHCQFLRSPARPGSRADYAVRSTHPLCLANQGSFVAARYSAACGGHTDQHQIGGYRYQSVHCEICLERGNPRRGHGLGLCQEGAIGLAHRGWNHRQILSKYFPATYLS